MTRKADPAQIARTIRDNIEELNYATINEAIPAPVISATMQAILGAVSHLPQAVEQLSWAIASQQSQQAIRMDNGSDPAAATSEVKAALADALVDLERLGESLQRAATPLFHMAAA